MKPYIVAVGGGSGSGKTSVVKQLRTLLHTSCSLVEMDRYYLDRSHLTPEERTQINYDHPDSIEKDLLLEQLTQLRSGAQIEIPQYDFKTHTRQGSVPLKPARILILDGIFSLCDPRLLDLIDLKLYVECDADIRLARRAQRDEKLRGRSLENVVEQYVKSVKPMHAKFIEPTKFRADLIIPWHERNPKAVGMVAQLIEDSVSRMEHS